MKKEIRDLVRYAETFGWECAGMSGSGHWKLVHKGGGTMTLPSSPGGGSWRKKYIGQIRRYAAQNKEGRRVA